MLPLLVLFVFGVIEFGRAYNAKIELTAAVREGARAVALGQDGTAATKNAAAGLKTSAITVTVSPPTCPTVLPAGGVNATVSASYPFTYDIPLFGEGTWTIHATGVMRCGA